MANSLNCFIKSNLVIATASGWLQRLVRRIQLPILRAKHASENRIEVCAALETLPLSINFFQRERAVVASVVCSDVSCVNEQEALVPAALTCTQANDQLIRTMRHKASDLLTICLRE